MYDDALEEIKKMLDYVGETKVYKKPPLNSAERRFAKIKFLFFAFFLLFYDFSVPFFLGALTFIVSKP